MLVDRYDYEVLIEQVDVFCPILDSGMSFLSWAQSGVEFIRVGFPEIRDNTDNTGMMATLMILVCW